MSKNNPNNEWEKKWEKRPLITPSPLPHANGGVEPAIEINPTYSVLRNSLPLDKQGLFDEFIQSIINPKPK